MSPPDRGGDILFLPRLSVRPSRNSVRSVTWKLFKIFSWTFIEIWSIIRRRAEHKNRNSFIPISKFDNGKFVSAP